MVKRKDNNQDPHTDEEVGRMLLRCRLFLLGLEKYEKGDWRSISRNYVVTRTPTQVASHAQKYFIRLNSMNTKDRRRSRYHDITSANNGDVPVPQPPTNDPSRKSSKQPPIYGGQPVVGTPVNLAPGYSVGTPVGVPPPNISPGDLVTGDEVGKLYKQ